MAGSIRKTRLPALHFAIAAIASVTAIVVHLRLGALYAVLVGAPIAFILQMLLYQTTQRKLAPNRNKSMAAVIALAMLWPLFELGVLNDAGRAAWSFVFVISFLAGAFITDQDLENRQPTRS